MLGGKGGTRVLHHPAERATKDDGSVHAGVTASVPNSHFVITPAAIRSRLIYRGPSIIPPFRPFHLAVRRHPVGT